MYTLIRAIALPNTLMPQWKTISPATSLVRTLFATYRRIVLTVTKDGATEELYVDMEQLRAQYAAYPNTLTVLLQVLGTRELETLTALPNAFIGYVTYNDIYRVGYSANLGEIGQNYPDDYPKADLPDIELTRPDYDTDLSLIHTRCLTSVNGFYHNSDTDGTRAWIKDGGVTVRHAKCAHAGMTSFMNVGELIKRSIAIDTIIPKADGGVMKDGLRFSIPDSVDGKSFFLVLGGYLVFPQDSVFYPCGDHQYELNLQMVPYLERLLESSAYLDLSALELTISDLNPENVNLAEIWSDAVLKRYLTLSQSFFVIVDAPNLFTRKINVRQMNTPGVFMAYQDPVYPLIVSTGRSAEYWKVYEDGVWAMTVLDSFRRNYIFNRQQESTLTNVFGQLATDKPFYHSQGFLLEIGTTKD